MNTSFVFVLLLTLTVTSFPIKDNDEEKKLCLQAFLAASSENLPSQEMCTRYMEDGIFPDWDIKPTSQKFTTLGDYCCTYKCKVAHFHDMKCRHGI